MRGTNDDGRNGDCWIDKGKLEARKRVKRSWQQEFDDEHRDTIENLSIISIIGLHTNCNE